MLSVDDFRINPTVYDWTGRTIALLEKFLKVNIKLHHEDHHLRAGEIFLFNHFARFETFIPQYLLYREIGALSRSVASSEFFREGDPFARYLLSLGAVSTDHPELLPFLGAEVLRGRKVILFPEGGMVKDRRVLDRAGHFHVYSRVSMERRKHHTGAAVVALAVDAFKLGVREAQARGETERLERWVEALGLDGVDSVVEVASRPTLIVPCTITFYPIRISGNILKSAAELFYRGLSPRVAEELLIEGNILFEHTDMDISVGAPVCAEEFWTGWDRLLLRRVAARVDSLRDWFLLEDGGHGLSGRLLHKRTCRNVLRIRDAYMVGMYAGITVNLSHLASRLIFRLIDDGTTEVRAGRLHRMLYLAVKGVQDGKTVHLHRSLRNPETYDTLFESICPGLTQLVETAAASGLLTVAEDNYRFLEKLSREHDFDQIRIENPLAVYANEVAPLPLVCAAVDRAVEKVSRLTPQAWARLRFDDEEIAYRWDRAAFRKPRHEAVNDAERATAEARPYLFVPERGRRDLGILLVHGFTASPAETRPFGERVWESGYPVMGVRLKGHGTSPWDLHTRSWQDWYRSVRVGYAILAPFVRRICLVGFSAGGGLCLRLAAERPEGLAGCVALCAPVKVRDRAMSIVPFVHGANVVVDVVSPAKGLKLFHRAEPEHPDINYQHMPIHALYELGKLIDAFLDSLPEVACPTLLLQSTEDPTVDPTSLAIIREGLTSAPTTVEVIPSDRHGILYEDVAETQARILLFLDSLL